MTFQCWRILNSEFWAKDKNFWPQNGPKTCLGASRAHLSTQKSSSLPHFNYFLGWNHFWIELSHQIPTLTNERKSVTIPKPTHFQNGDQMNISQNTKFCNKKNTVSHSSHPIPLHPTQSHHWCFNVETYCIYFWYRNNDEPKKLPGVDGRGLGWSRWDPSHSNPTPIPPGPIVQNCPGKWVDMKKKKYKMNWC